MHSIVSVILSGGAGARLWPASRKSHPKPFMKLADGETLIQKTYARAKALGMTVLTVTNRDYYFMSHDEQMRAGIEGPFLLEPVGRNTAPAIALAAKSIASIHSEGTVMLVLPADHLIIDQQAFSASVAEATKAAQEGYLVTFGIPATTPETGFGYIEQGEPLESGYRVVRFVEKPDLKTAKSYVASGKYLWNSGMFCFKAGSFLNELAKHSPEVAKNVDDCWQAMQPLTNSNMVQIPEDYFKNIPDVSVDYAVMEKSDNVAVIPGNFGWSDIGSWSAVRDLVQSDAQQNRVIGDAILVDTRNTFVQTEGRLVATLGVNDLIVVDTSDALLIAHPDKVQDVKKIVAELKDREHATFDEHRTMQRPWGSYTILEEGSGFKIKRIEVDPGASLSLQMHHHRSEHWVVVKGLAKITNGESEILIQVNQSTYIPAGQMHRLENPGDTVCVMIEVQCGSYLGEDDIVRFEDRYGR